MPIFISFVVALSHCIRHVHVYVAFFNGGENSNPDREEIALPMKEQLINVLIVMSIDVDRTSVSRFMGDFGWSDRKLSCAESLVLWHHHLIHLHCSMQLHFHHPFRDRLDQQGRMDQWEMM